MISLEQYRASIGLGGIQRDTRESYVIPFIHLRTMVLSKSVLLTAYLLLALSGDVELNPGPGHGFQYRGILDRDSTGDIQSTSMDTQQSTDDPNFDLVKCIKGMRSDLTSIKEDISDLKRELNVRFEKVEKRTKQIERNVDEMDAQILDLKTKLLEDNLIFRGIRDSVNETDTDTEQKVREFITKDLNLNADNMSFRKVYRQGKKIGNRAIVVKFDSLRERQTILEAARQIPEMKFRVKKDLPKEVREARRALAPWYGDAERQNYKPKIVLNRLYIGEKIFKLDRTTNSVVETNE